MQSLLEQDINNPIVRNDVILSKVESNNLKNNGLENSNSRVRETPYVNEIINEANSIELQDPPSVSLATEPATQPIVWQKEALKFSRISNELKEKKVGNEELDFDLDDWDKYIDVLEEKRELRAQIADIDFQLKLFNSEVENKEQIISKIHQAKLVKISKEKDFDEIFDKYSTLGDTDLIKDSKSLIVYLEKNKFNSEILSNLSQRYSKLEKDYEGTVNEWEKNPRELNLAAVMGAKSQEKDNFLKETFKNIFDIVNKEKIENLDLIAEKRFDLENIENLIDTNNKWLGYIEAYSDLSADRADKIKKRYLEQRAEKVSRLENLGRELPNAQEKSVYIKHTSSRIIELLNR